MHEWKVIEANASAFAVSGTTGVGVSLTPIPQGTTNSQRIGAKILVRKITAFVAFNRPVLNSDGINFVRTWITKYSQGYNPTYNQLQPFGLQYSYTGLFQEFKDQFYDLDTKGLLRWKNMSMKKGKCLSTATGTSNFYSSTPKHQLWFKHNIRCKSVVEWSNSDTTGTITNILKNLWTLNFSVTPNGDGTNPITASYLYRVYYQDA